MATAVRQPILYDVDRWRRYRTWLLLPATVCAMTALFTSLLHPSSGSAFGYAVVSAALFAIATSLWSRQRFSYLARDGDSLVVRAMAASRRLNGADIEGTRVVRHSAVFGRPERRGLLPRPTEHWLAIEAISIRLCDGVNLRALRRIAGVRCVIDDLLVVPVTDAKGLLAELLEHVCPQRAVTPATPRRRRRRR